MISTLTPPIKGLILDMDGVLWRGSQPIGDLPSIFNRIKLQGLDFVCATNNATSTPVQFSEKLAAMGVNVPPRQIINSAGAVAIYMKKLHPAGGPIYIVGENGLHQAFNEFGFFHADENPLAVVAGMDRQVTYEKLAGASKWILKGVPFIGTNPDKTFPTPTGLAPGAGSILAAIEAASGTSPTIIGKPSPLLYQIALERLGTAAAETLAVGDRLETDILGGQLAGIRTALVLSGVTSSHQLSEWSQQPDLVSADLAELLG